MGRGRRHRRKTGRGSPLAGTAGLRTVVGHNVHAPEADRRAAEILAKHLAGLRPQQSRNILQVLGLTRHEVPIDSRLTKWLNDFAFPLELSAVAQRPSLLRARVRRVPGSPCRGRGDAVRDGRRDLRQLRPCLGRGRGDLVGARRLASIRWIIGLRSPRPARAWGQCRARQARACRGRRPTAVRSNAPPWTCTPSVHRAAERPLGEVRRSEAAKLAVRSSPR